MRKYIPDFIVQVDDGHADPLNLVVEIKGYRGEDAKEKKATMETYWVPGVNHLGTYGRWAFLELKDVYLIQEQFAAKVEEALNKIAENIAGIVDSSEEYVNGQEQSNKSQKSVEINQTHRMPRASISRLPSIQSVLSEELQTPIQVA